MSHDPSESINLKNINRKIYIFLSVENLTEVESSLCCFCDTLPLNVKQTNK